MNAPHFTKTTGCIAKLATAAQASDRTGIIAYQFQESDDGKFALAEFVAVNRSGLLPILTSTATGVISFERNLIAISVVEQAFQQYKKVGMQEHLEEDLKRLYPILGIAPGA